MQLEDSGATSEPVTAGDFATLELASPPEEPLPNASDTAPATPLIQDLLPELAGLEPVAQELPDLSEFLAGAELIETPQAPPMDAMLTPAQPAPPRQPASAARVSNTAPATASRSSGSSGTAGSASGGSGSGSSGTGAGYFPAPAYPSVARSRGMQGTVGLAITFGSDGRVTSATIYRSSGYSYLDSYAADWARKKWRAGKGMSGTYRKPVVFSLR